MCFNNFFFFVCGFFWGANFHIPAKQTVVYYLQFYIHLGLESPLDER
jgi:hypothetical protein